jgi:hypothetical protein
MTESLDGDDLPLAAKKSRGLEHRRNLIDEPDPDFKNVEELLITRYFVSVCTNFFEEWLKFTDSSVLQGKFTLVHEKVKVALLPLISKLYEEYRVFFTDRPDETFIKRTLTKVIQRTASNIRRRKSKNQTGTDMLSTNATPEISPLLQSAAEFSPEPRNVAPPVSAEEYGIRNFMANDLSDMSFATVADVLPLDLVGNRSLLSQVSFDLWLTILKDDLGYQDDDTISYAFESNSKVIKNERLFRAAMADS